MFRLLSIEYFKLSHSKYFWILLGLFCLFLIAVPIGVKVFLDYMVWTGNEFLRSGIRSDELPFFDFVDLWQNLTWIYKSFSILLAFIVVISISQEFRYGTIKQNVIDGLSTKQFILSKIYFIVALALFTTICVLIVGLLTGFFLSPVIELKYIIKHVEFIGAYFLHLVAFLLFSLLVALLVKRSGITIACLVFYIYVIEPIATAFIHYSCELPLIAHAFPARAMSELIPVPLTKYLLKETQTFVGMTAIVIVAIQIVLYLFFINRLMTKRDLQ